MADKGFYSNLINKLNDRKVQLVAVSKTRNPEEIMELYDEGQRIFGENKVQELLSKKPLLPPDIEWHLIGSLQSNKVKQIIQHVALIHSGSSISLLNEINKRSQNLLITTQVLLQVHIAQEETKSGFTKEELLNFLDSGEIQALKNLNIRGLMGMASFTQDMNQVHREFSGLKDLFDLLKSKYFTKSDFQILSMGMSGDYEIAIEAGANMVRIGSLLFGNRG